MNKMSIENQRIFLAPRKDLGMGGWGLDNPYGVRILNPLEIIERSLIGIDSVNTVLTFKNSTLQYLICRVDKNRIIK